MHGIPADHHVRRRLFSSDDDGSKVDNFINHLQEYMARENDEKMKKWNFDFRNEVPLEGPYAWHRADVDDPNEWIGVKSEEVNSFKESNENEILLPVKLQNEVTPKIRDDQSAVKKVMIRKRQMNRQKNSMKYAVRRKIDF